MKKIILITEGWVRNCSDAWVFGALNQLHTTATEANLFIYSTNGNWSADREYNRGEYNLYRLPDFAQFDGIILDINNISEDDTRAEIQRRVQESGVPFAVIAGEIDGGYFCGINNKKAFRTMLDHLYNVHNCRSYWFISGPENNYENDMRMEAVTEFVQEHGIPADLCGYFHRDFEYECGIDGFTELYGSWNRVPDAIVCANDNIAVGALLVAEKLGLKAPNDFLITGFDDFDKARYYQPRITTVSQSRFETGEKCVRVLQDMWAGVNLEKFQYNDFKPMYWESCGCNGFDAKGMKIEAYMKGQIEYGLEEHSFERRLLTLESDLMKCNTVRDMLFALNDHVDSLHCRGFYIVANPKVVNVDAEPLYTGNRVENFPLEGYGDDMRVLYAYEEPGYETYIHRGMTVTPDMWYDVEEESGCNTLFAALHFRERTVGYFVVRDARYLMETQFLFQVFNTLRTGMETLYNKEVQSHMNQWLTELYVRDSMTMLYNRYGLAKFGGELYDKAMAAGRDLLFIYIDMDQLKLTNDTYGHEMGDFALQTIADAIKNTLSKEGLGFRLGGDEFLLIDRSGDDEEAKLICTRLQDKIDDTTLKKGTPFRVTISCGYVRTDHSLGTGFDEYMDQADALMYENKQKRKAMRAAKGTDQNL